MTGQEVRAAIKSYRPYMRKEKKAAGIMEIVTTVQNNELTDDSFADIHLDDKLLLRAPIISLVKSLLAWKEAIAGHMLLKALEKDTSVSAVSSLYDTMIFSGSAGNIVEQLKLHLSGVKPSSIDDITHKIMSFIPSDGGKIGFERMAELLMLFIRSAQLNNLELTSEIPFVQFIVSAMAYACYQVPLKMVKDKFDQVPKKG